MLSQVKRDDGCEGENGEAKERASGEKFQFHGDSDPTGFSYQLPENRN